MLCFELFNRHDILRTAFIYEVGNRPLQVVLKEGERKVDFCFEDLRSMFPHSKEKREKYINEFKERNKNRPFDLTKDVLLRIAIFQLDHEYDHQHGQGNTSQVIDYY